VRPASSSIPPPQSGSTSRRSLELGTGPTQNMTARAALRAGEIGRMRVMAGSMLALSCVGIGFAWVVGQRGTSLTILTASLLTLALLFTWLFVELGARGERAARDLSWLVVPQCLCVVGAQFAFGLVSTFSAAVTLGLALFASSAVERDGRRAYFVLALGYLGAALIAQLWPLSYAPVLPLELTTPRAFWWGVLFTEVLYLVGFRCGRRIQHGQTRVIEELERAVRVASQREALFREARDALKHAAGIGGPGRFSDQLIDGYQLGVVLGRGGMGEVYEAVRTVDRMPAALKLLKLDLLHEPTALLRFEREAKLVSRIRSPHVVRVLGVGSVDSLVPYIAMERLSGQDLAVELRDRGSLPVNEVVRMVEDVAEGLMAAHALHVVHRDLKPNNVFRSQSQGRSMWKVLDFGVSKHLGSGEVSLTAAEIVGTPQYMAPEQARGERDLDARVDVYGLGAIAYRCITGEAPFTGEVPAILRAIEFDMPRAPSERRQVHGDVDLVLAIALAKRPEQRFDDARSFAVALDKAVRGELDRELRMRAKSLLAERPFR
jgi:hypothetical protein